MNKIAMLSTASLCGLLANMLSSDVSLAGGPACTGHTRNTADAASFDIELGCSTHNISGATKRWEVSGFITSSGNHTALVTAFRPNGGTLSCFACATTKEGFDVGCTAQVALNVVNIDTQFTVGTVNVPPFGGLYVACDLSAGAWYDSVNF
jgi:hypothetical protein